MVELRSNQPVVGFIGRAWHFPIYKDAALVQFTLPIAALGQRSYFPK